MQKLKILIFTADSERVKNITLLKVKSEKKACIGSLKKCGENVTFLNVTNLCEKLPNLAIFGRVQLINFFKYSEKHRE